MPIFWQSNDKIYFCTFRNISAFNFVINRILIKGKELLRLGKWSQCSENYVIEIENATGSEELSLIYSVSMISLLSFIL